jgi:hypothetical protein
MELSPTEMPTEMPTEIKHRKPVNADRNADKNAPIGHFCISVGDPDRNADRNPTEIKVEVAKWLTKSPSSRRRWRR